MQRKEDVEIMKDELKNFRYQIDDIDKAILEKLLLRFDVVQKINKYKTTQDILVESVSRERCLLEKARKTLTNSEFQEYIIQIYIEIITQSKCYQKKNRR